MIFRDALTALRKNEKLTRKELADALGIGVSSVEKWERGETTPTPANLAALAAWARGRGAADEIVSALEREKRGGESEKRGGESPAGDDQAALFRQFVEDAEFPLYICDTETNELLYVNRAAERMIGGAIDALPDRACYRAVMRLDAPCAFCRRNEACVDRLTGASVPHAIDGVMYRVQGGRIRWNGRDALVRYLVREDSSTQLRAVIENFGGGVSVAVYEKDGGVRLAYANDGYYRLFGYTKEQFVAELPTHHDNILTEDVPAVREAMKRVREERRSTTFKYRVRKRDGSVICVQCSASMTQVESLGGTVLISVITDITDSVEAEQKALLLGQRLSAIMDNINSGVSASILMEDGRVDYVFVSDRYYEIFGYTREEYEREVSDPFALILGDDAREVRRAVSSMRRIGETKEMRYRIKRRDGAARWIDAHMTMMSFADVNRPVRLSVFADVTDMVEANAAIAAQRDQIDNLISTTPGGIAVIEADDRDIRGTLRTVYYNDSFFSYSGYNREEYHALLQGDEMHFVFDEDAPILLNATERICAGEIGNRVESTVRCHVRDGGYRWLMLTGQLSDRREHLCTINIVLIDITKRKEAEDKQRISEEMLRVAAETDQRAIIIYDIKANACRIESHNLYSAAYGETLRDVPSSLINSGIVARESVDELISLVGRVRSGARKTSASLLLRSNENTYRWYECNAAVVSDADGQPDHAVLVFHDITDQRIKEAVFRKWQQSIIARPPETYTLFRCNLSRNTELEERDGTLITVQFSSENASFSDRTKQYADQFVYHGDREEYMAFLDADALLGMFYRGEHFATLDYREVAANGATAWRRLTVEMVEYLHSTDVQAFLMYEDIDEKKKAELKEKELFETDPLTGALNRVAFSSRIDAMIAAGAGAQHALFMMDIDGFKMLNDTFGHAAGDQALMDVAAVLRALIREGDLVCRLGGDEFLIWLRDVPYDAFIDKIAQQMCAQVRKAFSLEVQISASIGVSVFPRDGDNFDELYHRADNALYRVKQAGKDNYAFFSGDKSGESAGRAIIVKATPAPSVRRRMLIMDDDLASRELLQKLFQDEYQIELAKNGADAMIRLRHFGTAISVVLLDLVMPGIDGFEVLKRIENNIELRAIPVIVVSVQMDHQSLLRAIEYGAADFITKPVDAELIRLRVKSAVSKAENERLRAQNSYLQLQRDEELKFHTVLESTGTVVIEYNWHNHVFMYDDTISDYIAGNFNHRGLWTVLLADMVADTSDVRSMQEMMMSLANDRDQHKCSRLVMLKTPSEERRWFRVNFYKQEDEFGLAEKIIITFNDVHDEVLADEKLRFRATRDELTGLYNRAGFIERAAELVAAREPGYYVMACVDIEKFKVINDQYGTDKGDAVLRGFARSIEKFVACEDGACCRVMADNFALLYPRRLLDTSDMASSHADAEKLDGSLPPLKFCIGRCVVDDKSLQISAIYDRAAIAKDTVKGRYDAYIATYDESMRASLLRQQEITGQMNGALADGQFEVWFQPQFNHATGLLSGAEALARWRHPTEGLISPGEFIPIFERNGFVYKLDQFVWEQTCAMLRRWLDQGMNPVPVSVNISRHDVFRDDLISVIQGLTEKYGIPADLLRLEITESAFAESSDQIIRVVKEFVALGFIVEIDDFGSGYSSLNTLKDVPAQVLKMDMRFLENDTNAQRGGSIIESVVRMARWLGMSVIAEGVETLKQADYLKSIGCEHMQGYLYSRPEQAADYEKYFKDGKLESRLARLKTAETWNNNAFWNPESMETLIFNSYVGGACIFEYLDGATEVLRYNEGYAEIFGKYFGRGYLTVHRSLFREMDDDNAAAIRRNIETAVQTKKESTFECRYAVDGGTLYLRMTVRQIAQAGERSLFYCVASDMTSQRVAERGERETADRIAAIMDNATCGITAVVLSKDASAKYLLVNDRYYDLVGYTRSQYEEEGLPGLALIHPDDYKVYESKIVGMNTVGQTGTFEFRAKRRDGRWVWLRDDIAVIALDGIDAPVQLSCFTDITARMEADERLRFISEMAGDILSEPDHDKAIGNSLERLRAFCGAKRCYIVEIDFTRDELTRAYEVQAEGVAGGDEGARVAPFRESDAWCAALMRREMFIVRDVDALDDGQKELRESLRARGARAAVFAPMWRDGRLIGFVGLDDPSDGLENIERLTAPADYLAVLLTRRDLSRDVERGKDAMRRLIDADGANRETQLEWLTENIPSGLSTYVCGEGRIKQIYRNSGFCALFGMSPQEYDERAKDDPMAFVFEEDKSALAEQYHTMMETGVPMDCVYRIHVKDGGFRWIHHRASIASRQNGTALVNAALLDITKRQEENERLTMAEEEYRVATRHSGTTTCRFDIRNRTLTVSSDAARRLDLPEVMENIPYDSVLKGRVSPDTAKAYIDFYEGIIRGEKESAVVFKKLFPGGWRWLNAHGTTMFSGDGKPVSAVISYTDVTEQQEKEAVFKRWQQRLLDKGRDAYTLYRCNLNKNRSYDTAEGALLPFSIDDDEGMSFNDITKAFAAQCVHPDDRVKYIDFVDSDKMLASYHRGRRAAELLFRGKVADGAFHWLRLSVELVEYPNSTDIEAYMMYEDVNDDTLEELRAKRESETDPLTGLLNRAAFIGKFGRMLGERADNALTALFMLDLDGFKLINDSFGHAAGDRVLTDAGNAIRSILRDSDLVCRLGGDEFLVGSSDMPDKNAVLAKAKQLCRLTHKAFSLDVRMSISLGIAVSPDDGDNFDSLYHKADKALYYVKEHGKDNCAFYSENMKGSFGEHEGRAASPRPVDGVRRKMLIVEDNQASKALLINIFANDFEIDTAESGEDALTYLRRNAASVHIMLLDLVLPKMDGIAVLEKMKDSAEMQAVPVIVVSGVDDRDTNLRAVEYGAADFVTKPVDADLLRVRVSSAIGKAENERLRLQNQALRAQRYESDRIRAILEADGTVIADYDNMSRSFQYEAAMTRYLAGRFDDRPLWDILAQDNILSKKDAQKLREMTEPGDDDAPPRPVKAMMRLKTTSGEIHAFRVKAIADADTLSVGKHTLFVFTDMRLFDTEGKPKK